MMPPKCHTSGGIVFLFVRALVFVGTKKKRDFPFGKPLRLKEGGYLLSRIALQYHRR